MIEINIIEGSKVVESWEYFCNGCGQLRLSFISERKCGNCQSKDLVVGKPGSLDKQALRKAFDESH